MKKNLQTKPTPKKIPNKKLQEALRKNLSRRKQTDDKKSSDKN